MTNWVRAGGLESGFDEVTGTWKGIRTPPSTIKRRTECEQFDNTASECVGERDASRVHKVVALAREPRMGPVLDHEDHVGGDVVGSLVAILGEGHACPLQRRKQGFICV